MKAVHASVLAIVMLAMALSAAGAASLDTPEAKRYASLRVGREIVRACGQRPDRASESHLEAELASRWNSQHEISPEMDAAMNARLRRNLRSAGNRAKVCPPLKRMGVAAYVAVILSQ